MTKKLEVVVPAIESNVTPISKPAADFLDQFKSTQQPTIAGVQTLLTELQVLKLSEVKDFVRLHPDEASYWSSELCFVNVPIKGATKSTMHLISEGLAQQYLDAAQILRMRLALATRPHDVFFLAAVPSQNLDNSWNATALEACQHAKDMWVKVSSRKAEGIDAYKITYAQDPDAFPATQWTARTLAELIEVTFRARSITTPRHPGLLRLVGAKPDLT